MQQSTIPLGSYLEMSASRHPDRDAVVGDGWKLTYREFHERVCRLANALRDQGIGAGSRVAIMATDSHQYLEVVFACLAMGSTVVPLNFKLRGAEVATLLEAGDVQTLFIESRYSSDLPAYRATYAGPVVCFDATVDGCADYEQTLADASDAPLVHDTLDSDIAGLAFTSGTTGKPKGVLQSQRMIKWLVANLHINYGMVHPGLYYTGAPMFHVAGWPYHVWWLSQGYTTLVLPQFNADTVLRWLQSGRVRGTFLVPTMLHALLGHERAGESDYAGLETIVYGAAPMTPTFLRRCIDTFGCSFINGFAAGTEAGLQTLLSAEDHLLALKERPELLNSIGRPGVGIQLRLCDPDWNDVPQGEVGEIVTRADTIMSGYLNNPGATAHAVSPDGWFRAGDLAWMDESGYLYLAGRKNDMIIRGGENVYPIEVEAVLTAHPAVSQCAIVGARDEYWGEVVHAFVLTRDGATTPEPEVLKAFCKERLAGYKVPEEFHFLSSLPTNASGKILVRELRELLNDGANR